MPRCVYTGPVSSANVHETKYNHACVKESVVPHTTEELYLQRLKRYVTAMNNGKPDRVPIRIFAAEFANKYYGINN